LTDSTRNFEGEGGFGCYNFLLANAKSEPYQINTRDEVVIVFNGPLVKISSL